MDTIVDGLLRRPGPGRRSIPGSRDTQSAYSTNPPECMRECKASFLQGLGLREGAGFEEACSSLMEDQPQEWFWSLYCCDSTNCGVYIELDPQLLGQSPAPTTLRLETATPTITTNASTTTQVISNAKASKPDRLSPGAKAAIGACAAFATAALVIALLFMRRRQRNTRGYQRAPPTPAQHTRTASEPTQGSPMPPITPPASSSSKTTPSTPPPLRLSDRRYLPPLPPRPTTLTTMTTTPPSTPPGESTASEGSVMNVSPHIPVSFPRASACAPTANIFVSPHERRATTTKSSIRIGAPISSTSSAPETAALRRSTSSHGSSIGRNAPLSPLAPGHHRSTLASAFSETATRSIPPPPSSSPYPARPPRPNAGPALEIPDLVTPAGPPPTWALPRPPVSSSPSSTSSVMSQAPPPPHRLHPYVSLPLVTPPAPAVLSSPLSPILSVSPLSSTRSPSSPPRSPLLPGTP
ncbi:hypothetical protein PG993_007177 [Apiospora rasikravindrae]|uniref:Uncharacterized protein n=1 Tax=Apiospora rasikravindrae TaxID=990691 RepID=A0ABR1SY58_9PEZI